METLGDVFKNLREESNLPLRKIAAYMDIDQAILSKFEHNTRMPSREQVQKIATYFNVDDKPLLVKWLTAKILEELDNDELSLEAIKLAESHLTHHTGQTRSAQPAIMDYIKLGETGSESKFHGNKLPTYLEFATYLFNVITGNTLDKDAINTQSGFIGSGADCEIYLFYKPDREWLKNNALTLNMIKNLPPYTDKTRLIFASLKYVNDESCRQHYVEFGKIPY
jgi:transcriptional regulator with XRE-family HTH domain